MKPKTFFVGIKGFIFSEGKLLLLEKAGGTFWEVPGGRINGDESIEQALVRELREEVPNIKNIKIGGIIGAFRLPKDIEGDTSLMLVYYKVSADFDGDLQISDEHRSWRWVTQKEAQKLMAEKSDLIQTAFHS